MYIEVKLIRVCYARISTVKSCIKAASYAHFLDFSGRLIIKTGLRAAVVQLLATYTVQSMHAGIQDPRVPHMTSPNNTQ